MPLVELENIGLHYEEHGRGPAQVVAHGSASVDPDAKVIRRKEVVP
jgi:hypothetical protein